MPTTRACLGAHMVYKSATLWVQRLLLLARAADRPSTLALLLDHSATLLCGCCWLIPSHPTSKFIQWQSRVTQASGFLHWTDAKCSTPVRRAGLWHHGPGRAIMPPLSCIVDYHYWLATSIYLEVTLLRSNLCSSQMKLRFSF